MPISIRLRPTTLDLNLLVRERKYTFMQAARRTPVCRTQSRKRHTVNVILQSLIGRVSIFLTAARGSEATFSAALNGGTFAALALSFKLYLLVWGLPIFYEILQFVNRKRSE